MHLNHSPDVAQVRLIVSITVTRNLTTVPKILLLWNSIALTSNVFIELSYKYGGGGLK